MTDRRDTPRRPQLAAAIAIAIAIALGVGGWIAGDALGDKDAVTERYDDTRDDVIDLCDDKANAAKPECATIPPPPEDIVEEDAPIGTGRPSNAQVRAAVNELLPTFIGPGFADYCGENQCQGDDGKNAPEVTVAQLAQAVAIYCDPRNSCTPPAPADGTDGQDAPRIVDIDCDGTTGVFTFDRGDPIRVADMCAEPPPEPEPTPEPTPTP